MATYKTTIPGLPQQVETSFPIHVRLVPEWVTNVRSGIQARSPRVWVQHETGNPNSFAAGENAYLHSGAEGRQASYHFCGDDQEVYVNIPLNEVTWQAADGSGPGNMSGVSYELCVPTAIVDDPARKQRSREIAAEMFGEVAAQLGIAEPQQHWDFNYRQPMSERHDCPNTMRREGFWPEFNRMALEYMGRAAGRALTDVVSDVTPTGDTEVPIVEPPAVPALDYPEGLDSGIAAIAFGKVTGSDGMVYGFNEGGPVTQLWLSEGKKTGQFPQLTSAQIFTDRRYFIFSNGMVIWRPNNETPLAVLGGGHEPAATNGEAIATNGELEPSIGNG